MDVLSLLNKVNLYILNPFIELLFAVALIVFLWGIFQFVRGADGDEARETGKRHIMYGIIGLFIMVSVYGILRLALGTFGISQPSGGAYIKDIYPGN